MFRIQRQELKPNIPDICPGDALVLEVAPGLPPFPVFLDSVSDGFEASTAIRSANLDGGGLEIDNQKEYIRGHGTWSVDQIVPNANQLEYGQEH